MVSSLHICWLHTSKLPECCLLYFVALFPDNAPPPHGRQPKPLHCTADDPFCGSVSAGIAVSQTSFLSFGHENNSVSIVRHSKGHITQWSLLTSCSANYTLVWGAELMSVDTHVGLITSVQITIDAFEEDSLDRIIYDTFLHTPHVNPGCNAYK